MRTALRIFRKDARHLWPAVVLLLAVTAFEGYLNAQVPAENPWQATIGGLWIVVCVFVCASAVLEESLPSHEQYWLTRPYRRRDLLAAKVMFALVFAAAPQIVAQTIALLANGVSPVRHAGVLAITAFGFSMAVALCSMAVAAVCESLMQFVWAALAAGLGFAVLLIVTRSSVSVVESYEAWVCNAAIAFVVLPIVVAVLFWQYHVRRTNWARGILAAAIALSAVASAQASFHRTFAVQGMLSPRQRDSAGVTIEFEPGRALPAMRDDVFAGRALRVVLPVRVAGIPADTRLVAERIATTIEDQNVSGQLEQLQGVWWIMLRVPPGFTQSARHLRSTAALRLLGNPQSGILQPRGRTRGLPRGAVCSAGPGMIPRSAQAFCAWPGKAPPYGLAWVAGPSFESLLTPVGTTFPVSGAIWERSAAAFSQDSGELRLVVWDAVANFERELDIPQIRLSDYVVKP